MHPSPVLEVRDLKFDIEAELPRSWHGGRAAITAFYNALSIMFPPGERFFIASVKAHRGHVKDEQLAEDVKAFCAQEGYHSREHVRYNDMLRAQGYPVGAMEKRIERLLWMAKRFFPKRARLAVTCALEHFTALLAHFVLTDPRLLEGAHPVMAGLWRWHSAEENEHKAVAFDVYVAAGGNYAERCAVMLLTTVIFWLKVIDHQIRLMHVDGMLTSPAEWGSLVKYLFIEPGGMFRLARMYLAYYRPGFHPWDLDNQNLLAAWRRELESSPVYHYRRSA